MYQTNVASEEACSPPLKLEKTELPAPQICVYRYTRRMPVKGKYGDFPGITD